MSTMLACLLMTEFDVCASRYTGKEKDQESGNDYFGARYYSSSMGRFTSPDWSAQAEPVPYVKLDNPQSLNLYEYVDNNPLSGIDPNGHCAAADPDCESNGHNSPAFQASIASSTGESPFAAMNSSGTSGGGTKVQSQDLSNKSDKAIGKAAKKYGYDASAFESAMTQAGNKYMLDPNLLVGLAMSESSLNPFQKNGGLFQIQDATSYGLSSVDIYSFQAQIPAAAKVLSGNIQSFGGNIDLGIASWTLGSKGTQNLFSSGGMSSVRNAWLSRSHHEYGQVGPNYIDVIEAFAH